MTSKAVIETFGGTSGERYAAPVIRYSDEVIRKFSEMAGPPGKLVIQVPDASGLEWMVGPGSVRATMRR